VKPALRGAWLLIAAALIAACPHGFAADSATNRQAKPQPPRAPTSLRVIDPGTTAQAQPPSAPNQLRVVDPALVVRSSPIVATSTVSPAIRLGTINGVDASSPSPEPAIPVISADDIPPESVPLPPAANPTFPTTEKPVVLYPPRSLPPRLKRYFEFAQDPKVPDPSALADPDLSIEDIPEAYRDLFASSEWPALTLEVMDYLDLSGQASLLLGIARLGLVPDAHVARFKETLKEPRSRALLVHCLHPDRITAVPLTAIVWAHLAAFEEAGDAEVQAALIHLAKSAWAARMPAVLTLSHRSAFFPDTDAVLLSLLKNLTPVRSEIPMLFNRTLAGAFARLGMANLSVVVDLARQTNSFSGVFGLNCLSQLAASAALDQPQFFGTVGGPLMGLDGMDALFLYRFHHPFGTEPFGYVSRPNFGYFLEPFASSLLPILTRSATNSAPRALNPVSLWADPALSNYACLGLVAFQPRPEIGRVLLGMMREVGQQGDLNPLATSFAALALAARHHQAPGQEVIDLLRGKLSSARRWQESLFALGEYGAAAQPALPQMVAAYAKDAAERNRTAAARQIVYPLLEKYRSARDKLFREQLAKVAPPESQADLSILLQWLRDAHPDMLHQAVRTLGENEDADFRLALLPFLHSPDSAQRAQAIISLRRCRDLPPSYQAAVLSGLIGTNRQEAIASAGSLGLLPFSELTWQWFVWTFGHEDPGIREAGINTLTNVSEPSLVTGRIAQFLPTNKMQQASLLLAVQRMQIHVEASDARKTEKREIRASNFWTWVGGIAAILSILGALWIAGKWLQRAFPKRPRKANSKWGPHNAPLESTDWK